MARGGRIQCREHRSANRGIKVNSSGMLEEVVAAVTAKIFPKVDVMLKCGTHLSQDGTRDEFNFVATHCNGLQTWYRRYGYTLIFNANRYAYLDPQGGDARFKPLRVYDMIAGQALFILLLDPASLQSDGSFKIADLHNTIQRVLGDDGLEKLLQGKRKLPKERVIAKARKEFGKAMWKLKELGFISSAGSSEYIYIHKSIGRFGEVVSILEKDPQTAIEELVKIGRAMWLLDDPDTMEDEEENGEAATDEE